MSVVRDLAAAERPAGQPAPAPTIRVAGIGKSYNMYEQPFDFMKEVLIGRAYHRKKEVLRDINFDIHEKEIVGIIGRNGAGKSTLLKIIAGTLSPTVGTVDVRGRVSAILELGTGFNPAFSGRENVILSALMRGMTESEIRAKLDSIVAFSGLQDVIDEPFHTYSSGMQGRLAFAAAVSIDADVIIIDEALSTGDARFAARSLRRIHEICQSGVTTLFVSHNSYQVMQLCTRAIWIKDGAVAMDGPPLEVVRAYEYEIHDDIARDQAGSREPNGTLQAVPATNHVAEPTPAVDPAPETVAGSEAEALAAVSPGDGESGEVVEFAQPEPAPLPRAGDTKHFTSGQYRILDIAFLDRSGTDTRKFRLGELLKVRVSYECLLSELPEHSCGLAVAFNRTSDFEAVMYFNTCYPHSDEELADYYNRPFREFRGRRGVVEAVVDPIQLRAGEYFVSLGILPNQPGMHEFYEYLHCQYRVTILANGFDEPAVFYPQVAWSNRALDE
jgi:ABC-type polysaccharide/polyol phosphate transport system ATPase subunit